MSRNSHGPPIPQPSKCFGELVGQGRVPQPLRLQAAVLLLLGPPPHWMVEGVVVHIGWRCPWASPRTGCRGSADVSLSQSTPSKKGWFRSHPAPFSAQTLLPGGTAAGGSGLGHWLARRGTSGNCRWSCVSRRTGAGECPESYPHPGHSNLTAQSPTALPESQGLAAASRGS